jgi:hypothetical protein
VDAGPGEADEMYFAPGSALSSHYEAKDNLQSIASRHFLSCGHKQMRMNPLQSWTLMFDSGQGKHGITGA